MHRHNNTDSSNNTQRTPQRLQLSTRPRPSPLHSSPSSPISPLSTLSPTPAVSASTNPGYTSFSLGKPGSFRAPTTSSAHMQKSLVPPTIRPGYYQPTLDQQQRPAGIYKRYDNASSASKTLQQQHQASLIQRQRIKGVSPRHEYAPSPSDPLTSLFQKMHSQAAVYRHPHPQDHITPPPHSRGLPTNNAAAEVALPPSHITNSSPSMFVDTSIEQTQRTAKLEARQERRQLIRAKAQEVRLELLALEQLEKEMDLELDDRASYDDLDQLFSAEGSPASSQPSPALTFNEAYVVQEPTSGLVRHPPQSPYLESISGGSQQLQGFQYRIPSASVRGVPSPSSSGSGTTHGVSPVSKLAVGAGVRLRSGTVTSTTPSPISSHSSPSPPISPLSESYTVEGIIAERDRETISTAVKVQQARMIAGWRPDVGVEDVWDNHHSHTDEDEEDGLHGYLHGSEEDLRDITLSDMMARNLNMMSDSDDLNIGNNSMEQGSGKESGHDSEQSYDEANMTMADRTCIFMSNLEHDFDQQAAAGQGIPSLLSEILPENDYDCTFISDIEMPDRYNPIPLRSALLPPQRNRDSPWLKQPRPSLPLTLSRPIAKESILDEFLRPLPPLPQSAESRRLFQSTSATTAKESIMEEFLRSLPPLPHSPESQRPFQPPTLETALVKESTFDGFLVSLPPLPQSPETHLPCSDDNSAGAVGDPLQTGQGGSGRTLPVLAPIVTSREHFQQILQRRMRNSDHRRHVAPHSNTRSQSPLSLTSPVTGSPHSEFSTPQPCEDLSSELSTPTSAYQTAKEEFTFSSTNLQGTMRDNDGLKMNLPKRSGSSMNMSSELIQPPPAPAQENRKVRIKATEAILTVPSRAHQQPLDMIIIRPVRPHTGFVTKEPSPHPGSVSSSPWLPLSPTQSIDSRHSEGTAGSSWSWSYPPSLQSNTGSLDSTPVEVRLGCNDGAEGKSVSSRGRANNSTLSMNIKIKSRSMSSLTKQQHGWLSFQALDVRMVASGRCHIVVVTRTNQVYSCWEPNTDEFADSRLPSARGTSDQDIETVLGRSVKADNGAGYVQDTAFHPVLVQIDGMDALESPIVKVVCSDSATFLLTKAGDLWGWGCFEDLNGNKIGLLHQMSACRPIQICSQSQKIKDVVCGKNHVLILNSASDVISWGSNEFGQLARLRTPSHSPAIGGGEEAAFDLSPHFVENLPVNILGIGANKTGSFAWDQDQLYAWGDNTFGQLGYESTMSSTSRWKQSITSTGTHAGQEIVGVPRAVALHWKGRSIKQVLGGLRHTVILSTSGLIITIGDDEFGQLGATAQSTNSASTLGSKSASPLHPNHSQTGQSPLSSPGISCMTNMEGRLSSSSNLSDASGDGILPLGSPKLRSRRLNPTLVRVGPRVKEISCGDFHTVTCCENGQMYAWGQGFDGILAIHNVYSGSQQQQQQQSQQQRGGVASLGALDSGRMSPRIVSADSSLSRDKARKVVSVSTMRYGVSLALVSSA